MQGRGYVHAVQRTITTQASYLHAFFFFFSSFSFFLSLLLVTKLDKKKTTTIFSVPDGERHQLVLKQVTSRGFALRTPQQGVDLL